MKSLKLLAVVGLSLLALSACKMNKNVASTDPVTAAKDIAVSLRENDFDRLSHIAVPPEMYAKLEAKYKDDVAKQPAPSAEESKGFSEFLAKYTAPDAETKLFAEVQPKLAQAGPQIPMVVGMFGGMANQSIQQNDKLTPDEKTQANAALTAITKWATTAPLSDPEKAKQAIKVVVETARGLNLTTLEAARKLSFAEVMQKAGSGFGGFRKMLAVYGFDTDKALDSVTTAKKSEDGDKAVVTASFTLLDAPIKVDVDMVKIDGHWYSKQLVDYFNAQLAKPTAEAAPMMAPEESPAANASAEMSAPASDESTAPPADEPAEPESAPAPADNGSNGGI
ncbi:MAG: hypothetical protein ABI365_06585 [Lysobacteraceae bacterium]